MKKLFCGFNQWGEPEDFYTLDENYYYYANCNQLWHPSKFFITYDIDILIIDFGELRFNRFFNIVFSEIKFLTNLQSQITILYFNYVNSAEKIEEILFDIGRTDFSINASYNLDKNQYLQIQKTGNTNKQIITNIIQNSFALISFNRNSITNKILQDISYWSFGIVTNGTRDDLLLKIIDSIRKQNIPFYEIIICGTTRIENAKDLIIINIDTKINKPWITKKKNLIVQYAKYENMCILHDRIIFNDDWYTGMIEWGNNFDLLCCKQISSANQRHNDWLILESFTGLHPFFSSNIDYFDWDINCYQQGQLHIGKKIIFKTITWNESYYWGEKPEDIDICFRARNIGSIIRFNPYSTINLLILTVSKFPGYTYYQNFFKRKYENMFLKQTLRRFYSALVIPYYLIKFIQNRIFQKINI